MPAIRVEMAKRRIQAIEHLRLARSDQAGHDENRRGNAFAFQQGIRIEKDIAVTIVERDRRSRLFERSPGGQVRTDLVKRDESEPLCQAVQMLLEH